MIRARAVRNVSFTQFGILYVPAQGILLRVLCQRLS